MELIQQPEPCWHARAVPAQMERSSASSGQDLVRLGGRKLGLERVRGSSAYPRSSDAARSSCRNRQSKPSAVPSQPLDNSRHPLDNSRLHAQHRPPARVF
jgi:hypothetical protein